MTGVQVETNAEAIAEAIRTRGDELRRAIGTGLRKAALAVERAQVKRLSGGGEPYSYPVPVRTGHLRRSTFVRKLGEFEYAVGNTASYAYAVHSGNVNEWAGRGRRRMVSRPARPFLDDAVQDAQPEGIVFDTVEHVFLAGAP